MLSYSSTCAPLCVEAGHPSLVKLSRSKLHRILPQGEIQPHKIRYCVERRDPEFEPKMVEAWDSGIGNNDTGPTTNAQ